MLCGHREQNVSFYPQSKKCNLKHRQLKLRFAPTTLAKVERRRSEAWGRGPLSEGAEAAGHPSPDQGRPLIPPLLLSRKFTEGHGGWAPRGPRRGVLSKLPADGGASSSSPGTGRPAPAACRASPEVAAGVLPMGCALSWSGGGGGGGRACQALGVEAAGSSRLELKSGSR